MTGAAQQVKDSKKGKLPSLLDDCERPACDDMVSMLKAASDRAHKAEVDKQIKDEEKISAAIQCPPKSAELGRSSWTLLHTMVSQVSET